MKFRDFSIRQKLLISNVLLILIPVLLVLAILLGMLVGFFAATTSPNRSALSDGSLKSGDTNYQMLLMLDTLCDELASESDPLHSQDFILALEAMESAGALVSVSGGITYTTGNAAPEELHRRAAKLDSSFDSMGTSPVYLRNQNGLVYRVPLNDQKGNPITLLVVGDGLVFEGDDYVFLEEIKTFIKAAIAVAGLSAVIIIVVTGTVLTRKLSASVLEPIKELRLGAKAIKEGNLNRPVISRAQDELGDTCRDFDDMRLRLRESIEKQQQAEESRKEMLAGISHDLSTPLTSIQGYLSGILDGVADTPQKREHYLRTAYQTACEMDKLVDSLFLFTKLDVGGVPFHTEPVDLGGYLADYCEEAQLRFTPQDFHIRFKNRCGGPAFVMIDRFQLGRAVQNLVDNSFKYRKGTPNDELRVVLSREEGAVTIRFADNGLGIAPGEAGKIFESFYRTDPARSAAVKGNGLGLAITRQIIETMGGTIRAAGELEKGLTVTVTLPEAAPQKGAGK